jgi:hypothetical protein
MTLSATCRSLSPAAVLASVLLLAGPARADDVAAAEALFNSAHDLIEQGDYAAGCPKFEASLALHASASTMLNIAKCHEHDGKTASAWADYRRALVLNQETLGAERQKALDDLAKQGLAAMEPRLPRLRIVVAPPVPPGLQVTRDGQPLAPAALEDTLPTDPGAHEIVASAPGFVSEKRPVQLEEGKTVWVQFALVPVPVVAPAVAHAEEPLRRPPPPGWVLGAGGAGLVFLATSFGFLLDDFSASSALRTACFQDATGIHCDPGYDYAGDNARKNRDIGLFAGFGLVGVAGVGAATYGLVKAWDQPFARTTGMTGVTASPWVARGGGGAVVSGAF